MSNLKGWLWEGSSHVQFIIGHAIPVHMWVCVSLCVHVHMCTQIANNFFICDFCVSCWLDFILSIGHIFLFCMPGNFDWLLGHRRFYIALGFVLIIWDFAVKFLKLLKFKSSLACGANLTDRSCTRSLAFTGQLVKTLLGLFLTLLCVYGNINWRIIFSKLFELFLSPFCFFLSFIYLFA